MWQRLSRNRLIRPDGGLFFDASTVACAVVDSGRLRAAARARGGSDSRLGDPANDSIDLTSCSLTSVLPAGNYRMLLIDLPNVPDDEVKAAVRWQIKDLLDFPVEDAVVELLDIPEQTNAGGKSMTYAVVARRGALQEHIDGLHRSGIEPAAIDIPELSLRNIAARLPQDEGGVALLHFFDDRGMLTVTRRGVLYFIRHIELAELATDTGEFDGGDALASGDRLSSIALDVQRSLDFYESHYDRRPVTELVLTGASGSDRLTRRLREQLGLTVSRLDLEGHFELTGDIPAEHSGACVLAVGAALRNSPLPG